MRGPAMHLVRPVGRLQPAQVAAPLMSTRISAAIAHCKAAMVQMTSVNDTATNFATCSRYAHEARESGCSIVFFPENFSFMGSRPGEAQAVAEPLDGPVMRRYLNLARETGLWLSLGGFQEQGPAGDSRIYNTHVIVDATGEIVASYRKIHLYDAPFVGLVESRQAVAGDRLVVADSPAGPLGVTICYDLRFPELYQKLTFLHGAQVGLPGRSLLAPTQDLNWPCCAGPQVLLMPSAFAMKTGEAHWETLLRCRAIENQCYVVAAAQVQREAGSASATTEPASSSAPAHRRTLHDHSARGPHAVPDARAAPCDTGGPAQHRWKQALFMGPRGGIRPVGLVPCQPRHAAGAGGLRY